VNHECRTFDVVFCCAFHVDVTLLLLYWHRWHTDMKRLSMAQVPYWREASQSAGSVSY
jgi:hypothetical protein